MSVCLSDHDLEAFVGQGASDEELTTWSAHLESCDTCEWTHMPSVDVGFAHGLLPVER